MQLADYHIRHTALSTYSILFPYLAQVTRIWEGEAYEEQYMSLSLGATREVCSETVSLMRRLSPRVLRHSLHARTPR